MKELSLESMATIQGGSRIQDVKGGCDWTDGAGFTLATISLFAAPFTGGISLGLLAAGSFVLAAYSYGKAC